MSRLMRLRSVSFAPIREFHSKSSRNSVGKISVELIRIPPGPEKNGSSMVV